MNKNNICHSDFTLLDAMPQAVVDAGGAGMDLHYEIYDTPFGDMLLSASPYGLSHALLDDEAAALARLAADYPQARPVRRQDPHHMAALRFFEPEDQAMPALHLVLKGTPFQRAVWRALLDVPLGRVSSYKTVAARLGKPTASRAVGGAVGRNPVSFFIPCHRILAADGGLGGYYWGLEKKRRILDWEAGFTPLPL